MRKKIIFPLIIGIQITSVIYPCSLCTSKKQAAHVYIDIKTDKNTIKNIDIQYKFNETFSLNLLKKYDLNNNGLIDKNEMKKISRIFYNYFQKSDYFINLKHFPEKTNLKTVKFKKLHFIKTKLTMKNNMMIFNFSLDKKIRFAEKTILYLLFRDFKQFFSFIILGVKINQQNYSKDLNDNRIFIKLSSFQ